MPLTLVATPIGNLKDISERALESLKNAEIIIGEERREASTLLKRLGISKEQIELLNEHSTPAEVAALGELCRHHKVALITDCGTPGFADPGAQLTKWCRQKNIAVTSAPGASSLMTLLSLTSERLNQFSFRGFLPADSEDRRREIQKLAQENRPIVVMDTPYRMMKTLRELAAAMPTRRALIALNLTCEDELILEDKFSSLCENAKLAEMKKAEFMLLIYSKK